MSGITPDGKLYMQVQDGSYEGKDAAGFLKHLLASREGSRIHLEQFPAYAPELDPEEAISRRMIFGIIRRYSL